MEGTRYYIYNFELISIFEAECESSKKFVEDFLDSPNDERKLGNARWIHYSP